MIKEALEWIRHVRSDSPAVYQGLILSLYGILTAILTYPVILDLRNAIAGSGDAWQILYILWYSGHAILGDKPGMTLTYTNYLFYPNGVPMVFTSFSFVDQLLSVPLQMAIGLIPTYNILWLLSFILAGYGVFLLVRYLTGNDGVAFVSGIIYAFCPYHTAQALGHLGATTIEWIPFCALFLMKMKKEGGIKNAILAGIFFILVAMSDSQYMMAMALFVGLLLAYEFIGVAVQKTPGRLESFKKIIVKYAVFAGISLIAIIPLNYEMIKIALSGNNFLSPDLGASIYFSADLLGFITPSPFHPVFGSWVSQNVSLYFTGNQVESTIYAGMTVLVLSVFGLVCRRKAGEVWFWAVSAIFFALVALGPVLHVMGNMKLVGITMPYTVLYHLMPFLDDSHTVSRFDVMVMLSLAVMAGYGLVSLLNFARRFGKNHTFGTLVGLLIVGIAAALIIFEFLSVPVVSQVDRPAIYETIGNDSGNYSILEVPASTSYACGIMAEFYATIDGKPMVGGQLPRVPEDAHNFEENTPFVSQLSNSEYINDILSQNSTLIGNYVLNYYNIGYVILHKDYLDMGTLPYYMTLLNTTLNSGPIYEDGQLVAYKVGNATPVLFMALGDGWYDPQTSYDMSPTAVNTWRWMGNTSSIDVVSPAAAEYSLSFDVAGFEPRTLEVKTNSGEELYSDQVGTQPEHVTIPVLLGQGANTIIFSSPDGSDMYSVMEGGSPVSGQVSFTFSNVSIVPVNSG